ncbi:unnamed protein product [Musa banksii]
MLSAGAGEGEASAAGPSQVVMVRRDLLAKCMTCPLCLKLLRDATTIIECLHTFCRKCIYEKLNDEETNHCPSCNIYLGPLPLDKLRPDHNLQDVRQKIFPSKRNKVKTPEEVPPMTPPVKRKERSLSSLVVDIHTATQTRLTKRQTKAFAKRAPTLRGLSPVIDDMTKKEDYNVEKLAKKSSSAERPGKPTFKRKQSFQVYSKAEPSKYTRTEGKSNGEGSFQDKVDIWKPLNCLVEAANRTKSFRSSQHSPVVKAEQTNGPASEVDGNSIRVKERPHKSEVQEQKSENNPMPPEMLKAGSLQGINQQTRNLTAVAQTPLDAGITQHVRSIGPIWFSLVAAVEQTGEPPLPQISASYLRVKDGSMPVSFVQKYLMRKLNLEKEAEVEIMCLRQPVSPTMSMQNLVEQWLRGGSSQKLPAAIGTSAKELVMVLNYGRCKVPADESQQQHS